MNTNKQERIVCAAVRFEREHEVSGIEIKNDVLCVNYEDNRIEEARFSFENSVYIALNREIKGFITNKNRFVDPKEAMGIAIESGQYPDYESIKRNILREIEQSKENEAYNESLGCFSERIYVADVQELEERMNDIDKLLERDYLKPEDLY